MAEEELKNEENNPVPEQAAEVTDGEVQSSGQVEPIEGPIVEEPKVEEPKAPAEETGKKWYVIQTFAGMEEKVQDAILKNVEQLKMTHKIFQILVPEEEVFEVKGTKRIEKKKKMFPGYVFLEMILDDESWYAIRQTPGVARFIGTKVKPTPVSDREMQRVLKQIGIKEEKLEVAFERGETIRVISGPFRGYTGTVDEINADRGTLKVLINIFGRDTPVEVNFEHAEKIV